jgi:hypothetical protein
MDRRAVEKMRWNREKSRFADDERNNMRWFRYVKLLEWGWKRSGKGWERDADRWSRIRKRTLDDELVVRGTVLEKLPRWLHVIKKTVKIGKEDGNLTAGCNRESKKGR